VWKEKGGSAGPVGEGLGSKKGTRKREARGGRGRCSKEIGKEKRKYRAKGTGDWSGCPGGGGKKKTGSRSS